MIGDRKKTIRWKVKQKEARETQGLSLSPQAVTSASPVPFLGHLFKLENI